MTALRQAGVIFWLLSRRCEKTFGKEKGALADTFDEVWLSDS